MNVLNGRQRLDAVVVVSSRVDKIDGAVVWLFIVAAAACRKLVPCQCCVFIGFFSVRIDVGLQEVSSSRYFDISGPNPVFPLFGFLQVVTPCGGQFISGSKYFVTPAGDVIACL